MPRESEFTPPSDFCPHPERWHAHDGMATEIEVVDLLGALVRVLQPDVVVETGTHLGYAAESMGRALARNGQGHMWTVEHDPALAVAAAERVDGLPVTITVGRSLDWTPPQGIDFAWFDSDTDLRVAEFHAYRPLMHERTVVGFHDTNPRHNYRQHLDALGIQLLDLPTPRGVTFGRVR